MRARSLLLAGLATGLLAGASVGVIVGASSVPQLKACVTKTTNVLRYTTAGCKAGEKLLTWNIQGVPGAKGATGLQGPAGAPGAAGVQFYETSAPTGPAGANGVIASLKVPAGSYLLDWRYSVAGPGSQLRCWATTDPAVTVSLPKSVSFSASTTILLACGGSGGLDVQYAEIVATVATKLAALP